MHQNHTIVRAPQGKTTKIGNDDDLPPLLDYEATASVKSSVIRDFVPAKSEQSPSKASEPLQNDSAIIPHKTATTLRTHNLPPLPTEPPRVTIDMEVAQSKQELKEDAPNQNAPEFTFVAQRTRSNYGNVKTSNVEKDRNAEKALNDAKAKARAKQDIARDIRQKRRDRHRNKRDAKAAAALKIAKSKDSQIYTETGHSVHKRIGITTDKMDFK